MLSEDEANIVMAWAASGNTPKAILKHLYELHRLRDARIHDRLIANSIIFCRGTEEQKLNSMWSHREVLEVLHA